MKVEIQQNEKEKSKDVFPHLGIYEDGMIVLFTSGKNYRYSGLSKATGTCLYSPNPVSMVRPGEHSSEWVNNYELFTGKITLSND